MTEQIQLEPPFNVHLDSPPVERWAVVEEDPRYFVSNRGRVIGPNGLRRFGYSAGYPNIGTLRNGRHVNLLVHRCVAKAFIPNPENKPQVNHLDGVRSHNHVGNLEWATPSEDKIHRYYTLDHMPAWGEAHGHSKLTEGQVRQIRSLHGTYTKKQLAAMFGVCRQQIGMIIRRRQWRKLP